MPIKNTRRIITKQFKTDHSHWEKMNRKSKKKLAQQVVDEVVNNYDHSQALDIPIEELYGKLNGFNTLYKSNSETLYLFLR